MPAAIKICGLTDSRSIEAVIAAKAEYAGFVFFPASPRHLDLEHAAALKDTLPKTIKTVSVLVDPDDALLEEVARIFHPHYVQLHGKESPERVSAIRTRFPQFDIIKAIRVRTSDDVAQAGRYGAAQMLMFDAKAPDTMLPGGNGLSFDWALLAGREFNQPWFLSGGLNTENVAEAIRHSGAKMVDVSSGIESAPGVKDPALIHAFVKAART